MYKLLEFIRSIHVVLLFVVIEAAAIGWYAHSSAYTRARLLARANRVVGTLNEASAGVAHYFSLGGENRVLLARVAELEEELARYREAETAALLDGYMERNEGKPYRMTTARVISNSINRSHNLMVLNRGTADSVRRDMAVLSPGGAMVGYVIDCSEHYAVAISVLNTEFHASGKLAGGEHFSALYWDGRDRYHVVMPELSKYAAVEVGAEVVSTGFSQYFPPEVLIGEVESFTLNETRTAYEVRVRLAADLSAVDDVILVEYTHADEVQRLLQGDGVKQSFKN